VADARLRLSDWETSKHACVTAKNQLIPDTGERQVERRRPPLEASAAARVRRTRPRCRARPDAVDGSLCRRR
jgi:hypothetical protein